MTERENQQVEMHLITIEDLVPTDHLFRKVNDIIDFLSMYDKVEGIYCSNNGCSSIDSAVLIKFSPIGLLYGINSERRISEKIQVNVTYRWSLGLGTLDETPDHSAASQNRRCRFNGSGLFQSIFQKIVAICIEKGLTDEKLVFTDSTHIKVNVSWKTEYIKQTEEVADEHLEELDQYEEAVRNQLEAEGKSKPVRCRKWKEKAETVNHCESKTGPKSGLYERKGKAEGMHYLSRKTVNSNNGIIIDVAVTTGNVSDNKPYVEKIDYIGENLDSRMQKTCTGSGYGTNFINQQLSERDIDFYTSERAKRKRGITESQRRDFQYDEEKDVFICPGKRGLSLHRLNRATNIMTKEYWCPKAMCKECPLYSRYIGERGTDRRAQINIFGEVVKKNRGEDGTEEYAKILLLRQVWNEGSLATQKARYNLKSLYRRGSEVAE